MLFNSFEYIFIFLPIAVSVFFFLSRHISASASRVWLVLGSLFFYSWWDIKYLPLITGSIAFNFFVGTAVLRSTDNSLKRSGLIFGICLNLLLLGYFKYSDFFISNINYIANAHIVLLHITLPLGISFFTFTQIAYLVDCYRNEAGEYDFMNYSLFVTLFPHLLAGPILHHKDIMPQFEEKKNGLLDYKNLSIGISWFAIGLFKKVIFADSLAPLANAGFAADVPLRFIESWITSLSYTLQLYFDFSGYSDMALGSALMLNIRLPINFNSPYKAVNIQEFWRRWHITLSTFLRDYVYIPIGGNQTSERRVLMNLVVTFFIGGLWHGAGWTFICWGLMHGMAMGVHRSWKRLNIPIPKILAWFITFNFVNVSWVFFRSVNFDNAFNILKGMFCINGIIFPLFLRHKLKILDVLKVDFGTIITILPHDRFNYCLLLLCLFIVFMFNNSNIIIRNFYPNWKYGLFTASALSVSIIYLSRKTEFLYFQF